MRPTAFVVARETSRKHGLKPGQHPFQRAPAKLAKEHGLGTNAFLIPMSAPLPETPERQWDIHGRTLHGRVKGSLIALKGTGVRKASEQAKLGTHRIAFSYDAKRLGGHELVGGLQEPNLHAVIEAYGAMSESFARAKRENDAALRKAEEHGAGFPFMRPIAVFKPLQVLVYVEKPQEFIRKYGGSLKPAERRAIDAKGVGLYKLVNGAAISGLPERMAGEQAVLAYQAAMPHRLAEIYASDIRRKTFDSDDHIKKHVKRWGEVLAHYGYGVKFENWRRKDFKVTITKNGKPITLEKAFDDIAPRFVANLALAAHLAHTAGKNFSAEYIDIKGGVHPDTCMHVKDVDATGMVYDIAPIVYKQWRSVGSEISPELYEGKLELGTHEAAVKTDLYNAKMTLIPAFASAFGMGPYDERLRKLRGLFDEIYNAR